MDDRNDDERIRMYEDALNTVLGIVEVKRPTIVDLERLRAIEVVIRKALLEGDKS